MKLQNSLKQYTDQKKIPVATATEVGGYKLLLNDQELFFAPLANERVAIYTPLPMTKESHFANLAELLTVQSGFLRKWREALAVDPKTESLILQRIVSVNLLAPKDFESTIKQFCLARTKWCSYLNSGKVKS